jgi:signal transduction histidine kinase
MRNLAGEMTELAEIRLIVRLSNVENIAEMPLGADLRREIHLIFKETINNVVKHSDCSTVKIEFARENNFFIVSVKDDGKGFKFTANGSNGANRGGNGLPNMRRRAANIGGSYEINSEIGQGTVVVLRVPLKSGFSLKKFTAEIKKRYTKV